jgi:hypothetical protein
MVSGLTTAREKSHPCSPLYPACYSWPACCYLPTCRSAAQGVVTHVDGVFHEGAQPFVQGWACQQGNSASVDVKIYADAPKGTLVMAGRADADSDAEGVNHVLFVESCSKAALRFRQAVLRATL